MNLGVVLNWSLNWSMRFMRRITITMSNILKEHLVVNKSQVNNDSKDNQQRIKDNKNKKKMKLDYLLPFESGLVDSLHSSSVP